MESSEDLNDVGLSHVGLKARSPEGHAARAMHIKGDEYIWIEIQEKTFKNWVNEQIKPLSLSIENLQTDFNDGLKLIALIEVLQKRKLKKIRKPINQHQCLENVQTALHAMAMDNIKLVNIGSTDIVEGNLKLILGLIWSLILRYQIGRTNCPPKKLMLSWLQAALPNLHITNFTSDWNSGIALSALLDYCKPGLLPHWKSLNIKNSVENCRKAMHLAQDEFSVPMILTPEDLASHNLDELSGMTYLSYFMKDDSPGYKATLNWVQKQLPQFHIRNFTTDWNDGLALCALVGDYGASVPNYTQLKKDKIFWEQNIQHGILGGESLGVRPLLKPKELSDPEVEHLGVMAYIARFQWVKPLKRPQDKISVAGINLNNVHVDKPANFKIKFMDKNIDEKKIRAEIRNKNTSTMCQLSYSRSGGSGYFVPKKTGMYELFVFYDEQIITGCPLHIRVHPDISEILYSGIDPCAFGSVVEVLINSNGVGNGHVIVEAQSPAGKLKKISVAEKENVYTATFTPDEIGEWKIIVTHAGDHIHGSPFTCIVYDPAKVKVQGLASVLVGKEKTFIIDASLSGWGELKVELLLNSSPIPLTIEEQGNGIYVVTFHPLSVGKCQLNVQFNSINVRGSPFSFKVHDSEKDFKGNEIENKHDDSKYRKEKSMPPIEVQLNHLSLEAPSSVQTKTLYDSNFYSKTPDILNQHNPSNLLSTRDSVHQPVNNNGKLRNQISDNTSLTNLETLSFHQRAELVNIKLMAHKENAKSSKSPAPPVPKKTSSKEIPVEANINENERSELYKQFSRSTDETGIFSEAISNHNLGLQKTFSESSDNLESKSKTYAKKVRDNENLASNLKHEIGDFNYGSSSGKYKKDVIDVSQIITEGEGLRLVPVKQPTTFSLQAPWLKQDDIQVTVTAPSGREIPFRLEFISHGKYQVEYITPEVGEHSIEISIASKRLPGSPFQCFTYDASQIKVGKIPNGTVGKPVEFEINGADAGSGNLEILVNGGHVTSNVKIRGNDCFLASFVPHSATTHTIEMKFNGHHIPGSPFYCQVVDSTKVKVKGDGIERVPVNCPASFIIDTGGMDVGEVHCNIIGPNQVPLKFFLHGNYRSGYRIEYTPVEVGDHAVDVRIDGQPIGLSPYLVKVYDASRIKLTDVGSGVIGKPVYFSIDASQAGAGNLEINVSVGGRHIPNYVQSEGNARFRVNFKPTEAQVHTLSVNFNGEPVPGSPCYIKVTDSTQSFVTGSSLRMTSLSHGAHFTIDTRSLENGTCKVVVTGPTAKNVPVTVKKTSNTTFDVSFQPSEVGSHQVLVMLDDTPLPGSPFICNVYDVAKVKVSKLVPGYVEKPCTFQVDASQAGEGRLELVVTTFKSSVRAEVSMKSRGLYDVIFVPQDKIPHYVNITFNDEDVPGSPFKIEVHPPSCEKGHSAVVANGEGLKQGLVGSVSAFDIETNGMEGNLEVRVTGPNGSIVPATLQNTKHNMYRVEYQPLEIGTYKVEVLHQGNAISSKPFLVEMCDPSRVKVTDVEDGIVGRDQVFKVDVSRAGRGNLTISIAAAGRSVKYNLREISSGVYEVNYIPYSDHPHKIDVLYNGHQAPGCPQVVEIRDPSHSIIAHGSGLKSSQSGRAASFFIETGGFGEAKDFDIIVISPQGSPLPVKCYQQKDASLLAEWPAQQAGNHKIEILYTGKPIAGSPFSCQVFDATKVTLQKIKTTTFAIGENISFTLNRRDAGYAELDVTVTSPLGRHLPIEVKGTSDGEGELIEFTPTVPGKYKIAITYGGIEVPGSPVTFLAQDKGVPKVEGLGLSVAQVECPATFKIFAKGFWGHPQVSVEGPETEVDASVEMQEEGVFLVTYVPMEIGLFDIKVLWNHKEIPGSPYHPRVVNTHKMRIIGGLENLIDEKNHIPIVVGDEKRIPFDVSEAGPGKPKAEVRGPSGMILSKFEQTGSHRHHLHFVPKERGEHQIFVYFNDLPLPGSPFSAYAEELGPLPDHTRVILRGHGLTGAKVGEEAEFVIDGSEAGPGSPEVTLGGVKADICVHVFPLGNNVYKAAYSPTVAGAYLLNVMWSDRQVKGCPLKVNVTPACDSQKVACSGDGLRGGTVCKEIKAFIDTRKAGPGELTAHCMGPHKVAYCELYDHRDGTFTLYLKPQEGGRHNLTVKYGGEHVPGSPFTVRIAGAPDASKVRVYGPGIEPGVLATYQSRFICDTRGAGAGQLTVRIRGPKGAFRVEMQRESQKDRTILCKYDPTEPGDYRLEVKWSGEHVPGSPFMVMIFDTQEELNHYIQGQYQTQNSGHPPLPPADYFDGSLTYSTGFGQMSWRGSTAEL